MGDPALSLTYKCTIDGIIPLGTWSKIEGLGFSYQVTAVPRGWGQRPHAEHHRAGHLRTSSPVPPGRLGFRADLHLAARPTS